MYIARYLEIRISSTVLEKRLIVSSIYPEKLTFNYRTPCINKAVRLICSSGEAFEEIKKGHSSNNTEMSFKVTPQGLEPWTY